MVRYPGRSRLDAIRTRLAETRHDAEAALRQGEDLQQQIDGLRAEVKQLSISIGEQLTALSQAIETMQRSASQHAVDAGRPDHAPTGD